MQTRYVWWNLGQGGAVRCATCQMCQNVESSISAVKFPLQDLSWMQNDHSTFEGGLTDVYVLVQSITLESKVGHKTPKFCPKNQWRS